VTVVAFRIFGSHSWEIFMQLLNAYMMYTQLSTEDEKTDKHLQALYQIQKLLLSLIFLFLLFCILLFTIIIYVMLKVETYSKTLNSDFDDIVSLKNLFI
jgi:hypothetical protein